MTTEIEPMPVLRETVAPTADTAARAIPPVWPLSSSVAVNPYLGQAHLSLVEAGARLERVAGAPITLPRAHYGDRIAKGEITDDDLYAALMMAPLALRPMDVETLKASLTRQSPAPAPLPTVADLAASAFGVDWPAIVAERLGSWAAGYFDEGQALWAAPKGRNAYAAWRAVAIRDLTPEILGLSGFAGHVADAPERALEAMSRAVDRLGVSDEAMEVYFHRLLSSLGGWAHYARYQLWQAEMRGENDTTIGDLLAARLLWEEALFVCFGDAIARDWARALEVYAAADTPSAGLVIDTILQEAAERADQRALAQTLAEPAPVATPGTRPTLHAFFCIDVRSERFRRALEAVDPKIRTSGFAGFFGVATEHRQFASDTVEHRLPVLLNGSLTSHAGCAKDDAADQSSRFAKRAKRAWGRFKLASVSSFAFVEAAGPLYVAKLLRDAFGWKHPEVPQDPAPQLDQSLDVETRTTMAATVLNAMSMTHDFAKIVLLAGHGASVTNNAHASALHCGACGGYSGEVNARLLAALLNDSQVRDALPAKGITIPADTVFVGALHDTTTDEVTIYDQDEDLPNFAEVCTWLDAAGTATRAERALRLPRAHNAADVAKRSHNWAEVRPEWGLAGCRAFIAAPRGRTAGKMLEGRAFLHDYDHTRDDGYGVLELIMTAPVVVASWISLQYYGSTVSPETFGAGNKLLHNVTGGIGVVEGNAGPLRPGLPWQSVHDGETYVHEPLRLAVCIEAPRAAMTDILSRHDNVRALFDNRWLHLFALDASGQMAWRYAGDLTWVPENGAGEAEVEARAIA